MTKLIVYTFIVFSFGSCFTGAKKISGTYKSTCSIQIYPEVILTINNDSSFAYRFAYLEETISGTWKMNRDTLFLYSKSFQEGQTELSPRRKYTGLPGFDAFIRKGKKLFVLTSEKTKATGCFLKKE